MMRTSFLTFSSLLLAVANGCKHMNSPTTYFEVAQQNVFASCNMDAAIFCGSMDVGNTIPFLDPISFPTSPFFGGMETYFESAFSRPLAVEVIVIDVEPMTSHDVVTISEMLNDMMMISLDVSSMADLFNKPLSENIEPLSKQELPAVTTTTKSSVDASSGETWNVVENVFDEMVGSLMEHVEKISTKSSDDNHVSGTPSSQRLSEVINDFAKKVLSDSSVEAPRKRLARRLTEIDLSPPRRRLQSLSSPEVTDLPPFGYGYNSDKCLYNLWARTRPSVLSASCMKAIDSFISEANRGKESMEQKYLKNDKEEEVIDDYSLFFFSTCLVLLLVLTLTQLSASSESEDVMPKGERRALKRKILCAVYGNDQLKNHVETVINEKIGDVPILRGKLSRDKISLKRKILVAICRNEKLKSHVESIVGEEVNTFCKFFKEKIARSKVPRSFLHRFCQNLPYVALIGILTLTSIMNPSLVLMVCGPALIVTAVYGCLWNLKSGTNQDESCGYPGTVAMSNYNEKTQYHFNKSPPEIFEAVPLSEPLLVV